MSFSNVRPIIAYAALSLVFFLISQVAIGNSAIDIHLHDTYFVIGYDFILVAVAIYFFNWAWILFIARKKRLGTTFYFLHIGFSILGLGLIFYPYLKAHYKEERRYTDFSSWEAFISFGLLNVEIIIGLIIFFVSQIIMLAYVFYKLIKP
jgi:cytochrome c oxidase subunit I